MLERSAPPIASIFPLLAYDFLAYDFYVSRKVFDRQGAITADGLEKLSKVLKNQGDIQGPTDLARCYQADLAPAGP